MRHLLIVAVLAAGCSRIMGYSDAGRDTVIPHYSDGPAGLQALFRDVLEAARKDDRDRVHDLMASTILTDDELTALFGPATARALGPRYQMLMATLVNRGAVELVAQIYERKYDAVEIVSVDGAAKTATLEEKAVARALVRERPVYAVRIKRANDAKGLRYDFFVYLDGKWRTGNQLGKFLPQPPQSPPSASPR